MFLTVSHRKCALSGQTKTCKHRIKFGDSSNYYYISPYCRYRVSLCPHTQTQSSALNGQKLLDLMNKHSSYWIKPISIFMINMTKRWHTRVNEAGFHFNSRVENVDVLFFVSQITTVCNFFTYIRYIQQGLVKQQDGEMINSKSDWIYVDTCVASCDRGISYVVYLAEQMYWEVMQLRREMSLAKLGYFKDQLWQAVNPAVKPRPLPCSLPRLF